jgi:hypothetical protein
VTEPGKLKVGVAQGGGPPPGYQWSVGILTFVFAEANSCLDAAGYKHLEMQVKDLAATAEPTRSVTVDVRAIEDFYEIRDHGVVFGKANIRLFFGLDPASRSLIILGVIKKQNNGPTPPGDKIRMRKRWRNYTAGAYGRIESSPRS